MSIEGESSNTTPNPEAEPQPQPNKGLWDIQVKLVGEMRALYESGADGAAMSAKADEVNRSVANLVDAGEVSTEESRALSAGRNPYVDYSYDDGDGDPYDAI